MKRVLRFIGWLLLWLVAVVCAAWAFGALYFDFPYARKVVAPVFALALVGTLFYFRGRWRKLALPFAGCAFVAAWWLTLRPSNDRAWQPDVAQIPWAEANGDTVTFHNVRNCEYRTTTDYTPRWETRTIRLSQLTGLDMALCYWGSPWMAHPIASFQFADGPPLCFSIETRKEVGESYSAIGGIYRQYELVYVVADERDLIRLRTNFRQGEDVYLYRLKLTPEQIRERLMDYITALNELRDHPRWYHALTTNCTTSIRTQHAAGQRTPWDYRILLNGKSDEMLFERGSLQTGGLPFPELKARAHINARAHAANDTTDFSARIRVAEVR